MCEEWEFKLNFFFCFLGIPHISVICAFVSSISGYWMIKIYSWNGFWFLAVVIFGVCGLIFLCPSLLIPLAVWHQSNYLYAFTKKTHSCYRVEDLMLPYFTEFIAFWNGRMKIAGSKLYFPIALMTIIWNEAFYTQMRFHHLLCLSYRVSALSNRATSLWYLSVFFHDLSPPCTPMPT